jgi:hypothetical protein
MVETSLVDIRDCAGLQQYMMYTNKDCTSLHYPLYMVRDDFTNIVATAWKHDEELGRGYLLLSTSHQHGKIWQWETGGGPIPIGKTLSMAESGCRSNLYKHCNNNHIHNNINTDDDTNTGSGGIIIDSLHEPQRLIVAEWGEGRITRLEENGARTPLIIEVPHAEEDAANISNGSTATTSTTTTTSNDNNNNKRLEQPFQLLLTPFGDLLVLDSTTKGGDFLWQLPQVHKLPGLESLAVSRKAHAWKQLNNNTALPQKVLQSTGLGGMAFVPNNWLQLYVTMRQGDSIVVVTLSLDDDDDEEEEDDNDDAVQVIESIPKATMERQSAIYLDYTRYAGEPGPIEVDEKGNMYLAVDHGILLVSSSGSILGKISIPDISIVDLTLGEDRFLYVATESKLFRLRLQNKPLKVPTDLIIKK